ncbi:hypothetical protein ONA92_03990 [Mycobacteroides salmoniphilum]|uniref:hypothetical protein n=1 Tax=Mycobacteroides salmoniphilum TaxID=404941 RepID=UPI0035638518
MADTPSLDDINSAGSSFKGADPHQLVVDIGDKATRQAWKDNADLALTSLKKAMDLVGGLGVDAGAVTAPFGSATDTQDAINSSADAVRAGIAANWRAAANLAELTKTAFFKLEQQTGER